MFVTPLIGAILATTEIQSFVSGATVGLYIVSEAKRATDKVNSY